MSTQGNITNYFNTRKRVAPSNIKSRAKVLVLEAEKCLKLAVQETSGTKARVVFQEAKSVKIKSISVSEVKKNPRSVKKNSKSKECDSLKQSLLTNFTKKSGTKPADCNQDEAGCSKSEVETSKTCDESSDRVPKLKSSKPEAIVTSGQVSVNGLPVRSHVSINVSPTACCQVSASISPTRSQVSASVSPTRSQVSTSISPTRSQVSASVSPTRSQVSASVSPTRSPVPISPRRTLLMQAAGIQTNSPARKIGTPRVLNFSSSPSKKLVSERKEMSLGEVTARLKASDKVQELRSRLNKFSKLSQQLEETEAQHLSLKKFTAIDVDVQISPKKAPYSSPVKTPLSPLRSPGKVVGTRVAAWQQYRALAEVRAPTLPLPWKYRTLYELFKSLDVVVSMVMKRKEKTNFSKLQAGVEQMTRHNFTEQHVSQITSLYPDAFVVTQEKQKTFALTGKPDTYELVIVPNFATNDNEASGVDDNRKHAGPNMLQQRHKHFRTLLTDRVKDFHQEFLSKLEPPMVIDRDKLTRWHPEFDAEQIPDVKMSTLPQPPNQETLTTARQVLDHARDVIGCNKRMAQALLRVSGEQESTSTPHNITPTPINPALRGVPNSLLEKIRAKQAARALEAMTRTPAQDVRQQKLQHLPEMARVVRNIFVCEKKSVMPQETVLTKLAHSYPHTLAPSELAELMQMLTTESPSFIQRLNMRQSSFLRVDKQLKLCDVISHLESLLKPL